MSKKWPAPLGQIADIAAEWAYQDTDYDEDTKQQIADGNELLRILNEYGVPAAKPKTSPKPADPAWMAHLSHDWLPGNRLAGCPFCEAGGGGVSG